MNNNHLISKSDIDIDELRRMYDIVDNYIENTFPHRNGKIRYRLKDMPEKDKEKIVRMYLDGYNTYTIGEAFDISYKQVVTVLDMYNIPRIYSPGKRKYTINEHYFDVIDTEDKAYILGMLYADGNVSKKHNSIQLSLQEDDLEIMEQIRNRMGINKPFQYVNYEKSKDKYGLNMKNQYRLTISSYIMKQALISHGCTPNKSKTLTFPNIPEMLYPHFIRGYFDGDGSIYISKKTEIKNNYYMSFISTYDFLYEIQQYLINTLHISGGGIYQHHSTPEIYYLSFCGKQQTKKIADLIYNNATIYMKRKHDRYLDYYYKNNSSVA